MNYCPSCHHSVSSDALSCQKCQTPLKAFGHPGIPLHQADQDTVLCTSCLYHQDDSCDFPQRPSATSCTLYQDQNIKLEPIRTSKTSLSWRVWFYKNRGWLILGGLFLVCFVLVVISKK